MAFAIGNMNTQETTIQPHSIELFSPEERAKMYDAHNSLEWSVLIYGGDGTAITSQNRGTNEK